MANYSNGRILAGDEAEGLKILQMGMGRRTESGVELHVLEALYLLERHLIALANGQTKMSAADLLAAAPASKSRRAPIKKTRGAKKAPFAPPSSAIPLSDQYLLYKTIRGAGHVIRLSAGSPLHWRVLARGVGREHERAQTLILLVPPDYETGLKDLEKKLALSRLLRLELALAFVRGGQPAILKISKPPVEM